MSLSKLWTTLEVEFLPVYTPNEEEKNDPYLYAENVRAVMADALEVCIYFLAMCVICHPQYEQQVIRCYLISYEVILYKFPSQQIFKVSEKISNLLLLIIYGS